MMTSDRIQELQSRTAYPESMSVNSALMQVWNEMQQDFNSRVCKNCNWNRESVCTNSDSLLCADFIDDGFGCNKFERIEK